MRLLLVGATLDRGALERLLAPLALTDRVLATGRVPSEELPAYWALPDLVAELRYPPPRGTSDTLLRLLAQGRPAIVFDLPCHSEIPDNAVIRVSPTDEEGGLTRAILRLAGEPRRRERLSQAARAFVARAHSPAGARDAWQAAIEEARTAPDPPTEAWPAHWRAAREQA